MVAAEAARTLARLALKCAAESLCAPLAALARSPRIGDAELMEAIAFEPLTHPAARALYAAQFDAYARPHEIDTRRWGLLQCKAALGHDRAVGALELIPRCGLGSDSPASASMSLASVFGPIPGTVRSRPAAAAR